MIEGKQHWTCYQCYSTRRTGKGRLLNVRKSEHFASVAGEKGMVERGSVKKSGAAVAGASGKNEVTFFQLFILQTESLFYLKQFLTRDPHQNHINVKK